MIESDEGGQGTRPARAERKRLLAYFLSAVALWVVPCGVMLLLGALFGWPDWLRISYEATLWLPFVALLAVGSIRFAWGDYLAAGSFFAGTIAPPALLAIWFICCSGIEINCHRSFEPFEQDGWVTQDPSDPDHPWPRRPGMVRDLLGFDMLDGLTRGEVTQLLGTPDGEHAGEKGEEAAIDYTLGTAEAYAEIGREILRISFSKNGTVDRAWVHND